MRGRGGIAHARSAETVELFPQYVLALCSWRAQAAEEIGPFDERRFAALNPMARIGPKAVVNDASYTNVSCAHEY